jgi:hypothetical protein
VQLKPGRGVSATLLGTHGPQETHGAGKPPHGVGEHVHAGGVKPLHVVDGQQNGSDTGEPVDDREECCGDRALVGCGTWKPCPRKDLVDGNPLRCRQIRPGGRLEVGEEFGQRGVSQHRFGGRPASRQHAEPTIPGVASGRRPQRRLADPGLALDDQRRWRK